MSRKEKALKHIDRNGRGIEIGPCYSPIAPKCEGFQVDIIDHMSREELLAKYAPQKDFVDLDQIEEVDFRWQGEKYSELTGRSKYYDWIIASHVVEHTPDLIGFLEDCDSVLKDEGVLSLIIPDKRYCFDRFRPLTGISQIIDAHFSECSVHSAGTVAEFYLNVVAKANMIAWGADTQGDYVFVHTLEDAKQGMDQARADQIYTDTHSWCFVPHSFRLLIHDLHSLGLIPFQEVDYSPSAGCEFFMTLGRSGNGIRKSRLEMLQMIEEECCQADTPPAPAQMSETGPKGSRSRISDLAARFGRKLQRREGQE